MSGRQAGQWRRTVVFLVRLVVGLTVLELVFSRIDFRTANLQPNLALTTGVGVATGLLLMSQAVAALRWRIVLGDQRLSWAYLFRLYVIGSFFSLFLPTSVGGDGVRAVAAARSSARPGRAMASVLIDRGLGVAAAVAYAVLGVTLAPDALAVLGGEQVGWHVPGWTAAVPVLALGGGAFLAVKRSTRINALWREGITTFTDLARSPGTLIRLSALTLLSQGLIIVLWYALARGMNFALPPTTFLWAVPVVALSSLLPITFSGLGVREAVWLVLLARAPIPQGNVVAFSLLYFLCTVLVGALGGILFICCGIAPTEADSAA